jgi:hypothetical protein
MPRVFTTDSKVRDEPRSDNLAVAGLGQAHHGLLGGVEVVDRLELGDALLARQDAAMLGEAAATGLEGGVEAHREGPFESLSAFASRRGFRGCAADEAFRFILRRSPARARPSSTSSTRVR